jgi:hypothetical protein
MADNSCKMRGKWMLTNVDSGGKWSRQEEVLRDIHPRIGGSTDPYPVVVTKNKVRGVGQSLQLEFVSEPGKACTFLGWGTIFQAGSKL